MADARGDGRHQATWSRVARPRPLEAPPARAAGWPEPSTPTRSARGRPEPTGPEPTGPEPEPGGPPSGRPPRLSAQGVVLDGVPVRLTPQEHALMRVLTSAPGRVWRRAELAHAVYAGQASSEIVVDVLVAALRRKLRRATPGREWIGTVDGTAYSFVG